MEKEQFEEIREFARRLTEKRLQMSDGQLLDQCQAHLDALISALADEFEEAPHLNAEPEPEPPPNPVHIEDVGTESPEPEPVPHQVQHHATQHQQQHHKKATKKHR